MSRLLLLAGILATTLLVVNLGLGWAATPGAASTTRHISFSFVATLSVLFIQAMTLFYLVGSARRVRQVVGEKGLDPELASGLPEARSVLPLAGLTIPVLMTAFIIGGGAHTGAVPPLLHGGFGVLATALQGGSLLQEAGALRCLEAVIGRIEAVLDR